jgi:signal-transduction protein with cAMP-binding, CBS, and nucleotidyltransferase domain
LAFIAGLTIQRVLDVSVCKLYCVQEEEPIISAGLHLSQLDVEGVVAVDKAGKPTGVIIGYNVLRLVNPKTVWATFYQTRIADSKMRVILAEPKDDVQGVLRSILNHGWGYAIVVAPDGRATNLIGLLDIANFLIKAGLTGKVQNVRARDKASNPLISISQKVPVMDTIHTMLEKHVRRLFVKESELVVSDRGIIKWMLSPANLGRLRDSPKEVLEAPISAMGVMLQKPAFVEQDCDAEKALNMIYREDARCLITNDRSMILTPWDLTISLLAK